MATAVATSYAHITKTPGVCGGKACIDNTRVRVNNIAALAERGYTPAQMLEEYPHLSLAQVHAALVYYYDHPDEIEAELAAEDDMEELIAHARAEYFRRRSAS
jgi:uncharacterized protein (DUF433 family)